MNAPITIKDYMKHHYDWVESVGWHNIDQLEAAGMVLSEIGELSNECRGASLELNFGLEAADIILRIFDMAMVRNANLESALAWERLSSTRIDTKYFTIQCSFDDIPSFATYKETGSFKDYLDSLYAVAMPPSKNLSPLAQVSLIGSAAGKLIEAIYLDQADGVIANRMANIIIDVCLLAHRNGFDILDCIDRKMTINANRGARGRIR